ncbi:hypothetical protein AJ88_01070 [Mesorhizobium amorphae CCBAU 01583]|nr:hypothetical protein AJ88_01070 [Mesorhizobium amorphae CCBAU 01583]
MLPARYLHIFAARPVPIRRALIPVVVSTVAQAADAARERQNADMSAKFLVDVTPRRATWRMAVPSLTQEEVFPADAGAAPHPPAGTFSPYSDGEKGLAAYSAALVIGETGDGSVPRPVHVGEDAGRQARGSADARGGAIQP